MKTSLLSLLALLAAALAVSALWQVPAPAPATLEDLVPAGPLLVLEAKDFASLIHDWNGSREKQLWLESANYQVFSRSRLYLRLKDAHDEFATASGIPPDMTLVEQVAGGESVLALYDIGKLEFLYVTRLPAARAAETLLSKKRGDYQPRNSAGLPFFVRVDPGSHRVAAFATHGDILMLATREDLLAGALALASGQKMATVKTERWFDQSVRAAAAVGPPGDLRLVMNFQALVRSPHFRSYWIQRNVSDLRPYGAGVSDLGRSGEEIREERVFLRSDQAAVGPASLPASLTEVLHLVPAESGLYRAWSKPTVDQALELLERKVLAPRLGRPPAAKVAPGVFLSGGEVGGAEDLETRIDEAPLANVAGAFDPQALRKLLASVQVQAMLQLESSRALPDGVFVGNESAVVLLVTSDFDAEAARSALLQAIESLWTTARMGVNWVERRKGQTVYHELDGLGRVAVAVRGRYLVVADAAEALLAVLDRLAAPASQVGTSADTVYAAGFRHAREREPFAKMMRLLDYPQIQVAAPRGAPEARQPQFFSENIASLSGALASVESATIVVRDSGPSVSQTVVYRLGK